MLETLKILLTNLRRGNLASCAKSALPIVKLIKLDNQQVII
jgi:hypothetical protein